MTVLWNIGERAYTRYIKHETAATTVPLTNGWPMDSGSVMLLENNCAHMCYESARSLVQSANAYSKSTRFLDDGALFNGLVGTGYYVDASTWNSNPECAQIPWDPRCSTFFRAFAIADRQNSDGRPTLRSVRFSLDATIDATNTTAKYYFAITTDTTGPLQLSQGNFLAFTSGNWPGTGDQIVTATVSCDRPLDASMLGHVPSRAATYSGGAYESIVIPVRLWFGWKLLGVGAGTNLINGFCAWESRIDPA